MRFSLRTFGQLARRTSKYVEMEDVASIPQNLLLPVELVRHIIQCLRWESRSTLISIALTCKAMRGEIEQALYCTMADSHPDCHYRFLHTIVKAPRLASLVTHYGMYERHVGITFQKLLNRGLQCMVNLKELSFREHYSYGRLSTRVLDGCTFQLTSFTWYHQGVNESTETILPFLSSQVTLNHISVKWKSGAAEDILNSTAICPQLGSLRGNLKTIMALAPGRLIRSLQWETDDDEVPLSCLNEITKTLNSIRTLTFGDHFNISHKPSINDIVYHLNSLEVIELVRRPLEDLESLHHIPKLSHIIITSPPHISDPFQVVNRLFSQMGQLKVVDVHVNHPTDDNLNKLYSYRSWDRTCTRRAKLQFLPDPLRDQRICKFPEWLMWA